jgi:hypothetical protein
VTGLRNRTLIEVYKTGERRIFHRTRKLCFTHPDSPAAREVCEVCIEKVAVKMVNPEVLPPCGDECKICHPDLASVRAANRRASVKRRAKK